MNVLEQTDSEANPVASPGDAYVEVFRCRCFQLIHTGYRRLVPKSLRAEEEPAITGELVKSIREAMNVTEAPEWMDHFTVRDNSPLNVAGRTGKSRRVVDVEFEFTDHRPRARYLLEAKWIGTQKRSLGDKKGYLGAEGIGCFLFDKYPVNIGHAGMLGYVHSDDEATWAKKIEKHLDTRSGELRIKKSHGQVWRRDKTQRGFHAYVSVHHCQAPVGQLKITHLLLSFC